MQNTCSNQIKHGILAVAICGKETLVAMGFTQEQLNRDAPCTLKDATKFLFNSQPNRGYK